MGKKQLSVVEYRKFAEDYHRLKTSVDPLKEEKLLELYDSMEQDLTFVGCSAIEDKLQDGVPETIAKIIETKIKLWVLTGDKQETAIEIGKSCKLI